MQKKLKPNLALLLKATHQEYLRRQKAKYRYNWSLQARTNQKVPPGEWRNWLILAGRGFGKTRTGAETIRHWVKKGTYKRIAFLGHSFREAQNIMVEGESGILNISPPEEQPTFIKSKHRLKWANGAVATLYSAMHYEQLRGPQFDCAWIDELAKFRCPQNVWDQLMLGLRLGKNPRVIITTTPRPISLIQNLLADPLTTTTRGTTFENAENLAPAFVNEILSRYQNTHIGAQEIYAEILSQNKDALWKPSDIFYKHP